MILNFDAGRCIGRTPQTRFWWWVRLGQFNLKGKQIRGIGYQEGVFRVCVQPLLSLLIIKFECRRNWLRDYSQAVDIGSLKKLPVQVRSPFSLS